ncbi:hypothetical protein L207DRAFT_535975 [Hyaloscypha variabilis F]|uniref:Uncharacterized protein n=1 Tax=Hyaloscypha variabilis (strain UAMH 11265 / GT02V1 / F) TaxID=1149755 RepID=A0A2J6R2C9_HYAVF|nr:hypothetical protein L207DRAFT_535975 [Hyaloscypha variabilis F]
MSQPPKFETGSRAGTGPHVTLAEITALRDHWLNIVNDYEVFHENYSTDDPEVKKAFLRAKLPTREQLKEYLALANKLYAKILAGRTPQRGQANIRWDFERLVRLRDDIRGYMDRLQVELRALGLREPGEDEDEEDETTSQNPTISSEVVEPPSPVPANQSHFGPNPNPPAYRPTMQIPSFAQRLLPGYRERSVSPPAARSSRPPPPNQQAFRPGVESDEMRRLRDDNRHLQEENTGLRTELADTVHDVNHVIQELKARDAEIGRLKAALEKEKNNKK